MVTSNSNKPGYLHNVTAATSASKDRTIDLGNTTLQPGAMENPEPQGTMLESLTDQDFSVHTNNIKSLAINNTQMSASVAPSTLVQPRMDAATSIKEDCKTQMGNIADTVRQAQREVIMACAIGGINPGEAFPDTNMADGGETMFFAQACAQGFNGGGTLATMGKGISNMDVVMEAAGDRKGAKDPAALQQRVLDILVSKQNNPAMQARFDAHHQLCNPDQKEPPKMLDWQQFAQKHQSLKDLMSIKPDEIEKHGDLLPEVAELNEQLADVGIVEVSLQKTIDRQLDGTNIGEITLAAKQGNTDALKAQIGNSRELEAFVDLPLSGVGKSMNAMDVFEMGGATRVAAALKNQGPDTSIDWEMDPRLLRNKELSGPSPGSGMGA